MVLWPKFRCELVARGAKAGALAFLAVEDPAHPWPPLPNQKTSAGPFYLVWDHPQRSDVRVEQWPYALASIPPSAESPVHRWPQLLVAGESFDRRCCSNGAEGVYHVLSSVPSTQRRWLWARWAPISGQPMNVTRYLTEAGLRAIVAQSGCCAHLAAAQRMTGFLAAEDACRIRRTWTRWWPICRPWLRRPGRRPSNDYARSS